jgi:hypothetical protein
VFEDGEDKINTLCRMMDIKEQTNREITRERIHPDSFGGQDLLAMMSWLGDLLQRCENKEDGEDVEVITTLQWIW